MIKRFLKLLLISIVSIAVAFIVLGAISGLTYKSDYNFFDKFPTFSVLIFLLFAPAIYYYQKYVKEDQKSMKQFLFVIGLLCAIPAILQTISHIPTLYLFFIIGVLYLTANFLFNSLNKYYNVLIALVIINLLLEYLIAIRIFINYYQTLYLDSFMVKMDSVLTFFLFIIFFSFVNIKITKAIRSFKNL